jgi:CRP-like cAMP-binding protein
MAERSGAPLLLSDAVRRAGRTVEFGDHQILFVEGDRPERVILIDAGWVLLSCAGDNGKQIVLGLCGPGDILGEVSIFDEGLRSATATALTPVRATVSPIAALRVAVGDIAVAHEMIALLIARLRNADRQRIELATPGRVARRLVVLGDRFGELDGDAIRLALPLSQEQLANWCGASREATVKALASLRALRIISTGRRSVLIQDPGALRRYAAGRA